MTFDPNIKHTGLDRTTNIEQYLAGELATFVNGGSQTFLPASNGSDDTTALQAILTAGGNIAGKKGESYKISAPLVLSSNTRLDMTGCTITLTAGSNCQMVLNAARAAGGNDTNIEILGGTWNRGTNTGGASVFLLHTMILQRVNGLWIHDLTVTTGAGVKFAINVYACSSFDVRRITFDVGSDGVHLSGTCTNGHVSDIYGVTGDDTVAITTVDYAAYNNGDLGDCGAITIERIDASQTNGSGNGNGVRLIAGNIAAAPTYIYDVTVRDVATLSTNGDAIQAGGDNADAGCIGGVIRNLTLDNIVSNGAGVTNHAVSLTYSTFRGLKIVRVSSPQGGGYALNLAAGATVEDVTLDGGYWNPLAGKNTINMVAAAPFPTIATLRIFNCRLNVATKSASIIGQNSASCTIGTVFVENLVVDQAAHAIGDFYGTVDLQINGLKVVSVNDLMNVRAGATVNLVRATGISGPHSRFIANAGTLTGMIVSQGTGAPTIAGQVGDLYDRQDGGPGTYRYRCTVAGNDAAATWAADIPRSEIALAARKVVSEPFYIGLCLGAQLPVSGDIDMTLNSLKAGDVATGLIAPVSVTAGSLTLAKVGLVDQNGNLLASSGDLSATFNGISLGLKTFAFASPYTALTNMPVYAVLIQVGTTPLTVRRGDSSTTESNVVNGGLRPSAVMAGQTDLPSSGITFASFGPFIYLGLY